MRAALMPHFEAADLWRRTSRLDVADDLHGVLGTAAGIAALVRVWRATRVDPMSVLRAE
jgi:hypothetical protein